MYQSETMKAAKIFNSIKMFAVIEEIELIVQMNKKWIEIQIEKKSKEKNQVNTNTCTKHDVRCFHFSYFQ